MADVFISYARPDEAAAKRVAASLTKAGYSVWWDGDLPAHRAYSDEIEKQLHASRAVVVLWSKEAVASQWVRAEADLARNAGKLVQASLDGATPPLPFNQIQFASLERWRGAASHAGWSKIRSSIAALATGDGDPIERDKPETRQWPSRRVALLAIGLVLVLAAALWAFTQWRGDGADRPVVAVLPFKSIGAKDDAIVAGLWEDTRQAISRNPQLLVLGPNTAEEIAGKDSKAARRLADYLVEASVRSAGDRIRVSANLVRTEDGAAVWSKNFERQDDDIFALQSEIAGEIEGHIRGRLAERGGTQPENIATTGEVYALYSDARRKIRQRQIAHYQEAVDQLEQVVRTDPNFAPGWATLAVAKSFGASSARSSSSVESDARRAVSLAPNLAAGHAALGLVLGQSPAAEASLRRALELDPNDIEALNWLANLLDEQSKSTEKLALYTRIARIEPLWWPAVFNKIDLLLEIGDSPAVARELQTVEQSGDQRTLAAVRAYILQRRGDLSGAIRTGLPHLEGASPDQRELLVQLLLHPLLLLGKFDVADHISPPPGPFVPSLRANDPRALDMIEGMMPPARYWRFGSLAMVTNRVYLNNGQGARLARQYAAVARTPEQFMQVVGRDRFPVLAPTTAIALRTAGDDRQAQAVLLLAERTMAKRAPRDLEAQAMMARIFAVQGRTGDAFDFLNRAIDGGWLPNYFEVHSDIANDPAFATLAPDPRFEQARQRILRTLARERAELGTVRV